jgi:hypothetical protein
MVMIIEIMGLNGLLYISATWIKRSKAKISLKYYIKNKNNIYYMHKTSIIVIIIMPKFQNYP